MTELFKYLTPSWPSPDQQVDRLLNSLERDGQVIQRATHSREQPYVADVKRPPLYPFSPM